MTIRIGSQIVRGELFNLHRNSVHGWVEFADESGLRIDLTGNLLGELAGQQFRFEAAQPTSDRDCPASALEALSNPQVGVTGEIKLLNGEGKTRLQLEWFSQNGQIVAELVEPILSFGPTAEEPDQEEESNTSALPDDLSDVFGSPSLQDDPYQLFPVDFERQLYEASHDEPVTDPAGDDAADSKPRSWDEVIPGIDPETQRMYEEWDEVVDGTKDVPFTSLFDPPLTLKKPADITTEDEAIEALRTLLARLAVHCVVVHMCEHYTALETYRWLVEDLLPEEGVHPNLGPTGFVRHYDTSEHCDACEARFDAEWNEQNGES